MSSPSGEGFPKAVRVRRRREYLAVSRAGERRQSAHFTLVCAPTRGATRLGITVTRKVGGAVARNRIKRRVREAFRRDPQHLVAGHDVIVIAKHGAADVPSREVACELAAALTSQPARSRRRS